MDHTKDSGRTMSAAALENQLWWNRVAHGGATVTPGVLVSTSCGSSQWIQLQHPPMSGITSTSGGEARGSSESNIPMSMLMGLNSLGGRLGGGFSSAAQALAAGSAATDQRSNKPSEHHIVSPTTGPLSVLSHVLNVANGTASARPQGLPSGMFLGQPQLRGIGEGFGGSAASLNGLVRSGSPDCPRGGGVAVGGVEGLTSGSWGNYSSVLSGQASDVAVESYNKYCHFCQHVKVKRADSMFACQNKHCSRRFCEHCLKVHLACSVSEDAGALSPANKDWSCPVCRKTCCCSLVSCTQDHRHCKAYRYRRRRAEQVKRPLDSADGPGADVVVDSPEGPKTPSPSWRGGCSKAAKKGDEPAPRRNGSSIEDLLDGNADTQAWHTPTFWKSRTPAASVTECTQSLASTSSLASSESTRSSPAPSEASVKDESIKEGETPGVAAA